MISTATRRSSAPRYWLRELMARPSGSRNQYLGAEERRLLAHGAEVADDLDRDAALLGTQILVARAHGEAVGLAHRRPRHDVDGEGEVADQVADHLQLLVVLASEQGNIRPHQVEQTRHHAGHAIEMTGARGTLQNIGQTGHADAHRRLDPERVHRLDPGQEQQIATGPGQALGIGLGGARVAGKVLVRAELGRVDEHTGHHPVGVAAGQFDERMVTRVQVAHGRHQRDALAALTPAGEMGAQFGHPGDGADHA